jgi:N-hydroxyarylamine O-acetyltransferase
VDTHSFNLHRYLARIALAGAESLPPDGATLAAVQRAHATTIPFENLDPLLGRPVSLELADLEAKLVAGRRGGYCFEQNHLLAAALDALGFTVTRLAGRVRWMAPPDRPDGSRTHMCLRVDLPDGPWLADAGFGGHLMTAPLRLERDVVQETPAGTFRLTGDDRLLLQTRFPSGWVDMYRFTLDPTPPIDYIVGNWYTATHPASRFTNDLLIQLATPTGRTTLFNTTLTERTFAGASTERTLRNAAELGEVLEKTFAIDPPADPETIWRRISGGAG